MMKSGDRHDEVGVPGGTFQEPRPGDRSSSVSASPAEGRGDMLTTSCPLGMPVRSQPVHPRTGSVPPSETDTQLLRGPSPEGHSVLASRVSGAHRDNA